MSAIKFRLLGSLRVDSQNGSIDLGPPKQRAVLAVLILNANEVVPIERIVGLVWGEEPPRTAYHSVQLYVSDLRKAFANGAPSNLLETRPPGYVLNTPPDSIDVQVFERLVRDGLAAVRTGDVVRGRPMLERALDLWTPSPLSDFAYDEFAQGYVRSLTEMQADAAQALASLYLDDGDLDQAKEYSRRVVDSDPLREEPRRLMMLALYRSGRQAEALREYGDYQRLLGEEMGIDPSSDLKDLEERILLQDPTLSTAEPDRVADGNPYRGLRAFSEEDAAVYFGREDLIDEVLDRFREGHGFVSIVGPSGSGKSSAVQAGVMPALREAGETVVLLQPGSRPLWELAGALDRAGLGSRATLLRRFENEPDSLAGLVERPVVIVIDQFEELFTLAEPDDATRFGQLVARAVRDPRCRLRVVTTLRADYYDRPLSMPELAGVFADAAVSVKPMSAQGIERAVVEPARAVGRQVEPALLAQIVADMVDEPGALPLLQYTLFELFELSENGLTMEGYREIGGIHGALAQGAEETLDELDAEGKAIVEQLFMRMIRKGRAAATSRPATLRELLDLEDDRVALQGVLEAFGARRLLTFGRDASGSAVVEIAHEYLISEWPQLGTWIEEHSDDLDRLVALGTVAQDWEDSDRSEDYLLRGERLDATSRWADLASLKLTRGEAAFVEASVALREREERATNEREEREENLARSARRRLWAFGGAIAALAAVVTFLVMALMPEPPPDAVLWSESAEGTFGALIVSGFAAGAARHDLTTRHIIDDVADIGNVEEFIDRGTRVVFMLASSFLQSAAVHQLVLDHPETQFVWIDGCPFGEGRPAPHESCIKSRQNEMGFLAGVAGAQLTETDHIGVVVGTDLEMMNDFLIGMRQGAAYVDPQVEVSSIYLTEWPDSSGFLSPTLGALATEILISEGVDVVYEAAGDSGFGVMDAVSREFAENSRFVWAIGVDTDRYLQIEAREGFSGRFPLAFTWQNHLLTSTVKNLDLIVEEAVDQFFTTGVVDDELWLTIGNGGIDYVTTGGYIDDYVDVMEEAKQAVIDGSIVVESIFVATHTPFEIRMLEDLIGR